MRIGWPVSRSGRQVGPFVWIALLATITSACAHLAPRSAEQPLLLLVSIDGFRWDFLSRGETPNLDSLVARGTGAGKLIPSFPTKTFPNHYTIVTGLYPEHHGLIANNIYDPEFDTVYRLGKREEVRNGRWYGGEPIWVSAEKQGLITAPYFWPGSEAEIAGYRPTIWQPFSQATSNRDRIDTVLGYLDLPRRERPSFLTLYFDSIDHAAHRYGPKPSPQLQEAVEEIDGAVGYLLRGVRSRGLEAQLNLIIVSDHGMAQNSRERVIVVDDYVDVQTANPVDWDPVLALWPAPEQVEEIYSRLHGAHPNLKVYRRTEVPEELHFRSHRRIPPIVALADEGWAVSTRQRLLECAKCYTGGSHGFSPSAGSMAGIFIAAGPAFRPDTRLESVANIHLYELMCAVLGIEAAPNDGELKAVRSLLQAR